MSGKQEDLFGAPSTVAGNNADAIGNVIASGVPWTPEAPPKGPRLRRLVLEAILERGAEGATCDELEIWLELTHQCASPRVHELMSLGLIVGQGKRLTRSGRKATVWIFALVKP